MCAASAGEEEESEGGNRSVRSAGALLLLCVWVPRCAQQHSSAHRSAAKAEAARLGLFGRGGLPLTGLGLRSQLLELLVFVVVISQPGLESLGRN